MGLALWNALSTPGSHYFYCLYIDSQGIGATQSQDKFRTFRQNAKDYLYNNSCLLIHSKACRFYTSWYVYVSQEHDRLQLALPKLWPQLMLFEVASVEDCQIHNGQHLEMKHILISEWTLHSQVALWVMQAPVSDENDPCVVSGPAQKQH